MFHCDHDLTGRASSSTQPVERSAISYFIKDIADADGTILPIAVQLNHYLSQDMSTPINNVLIFELRYSKQYLLHLYEEQYSEPVFKVC